jgi:hypothetical protein
MVFYLINWDEMRWYWINPRAVDMGRMGMKKILSQKRVERCASVVLVPHRNPASNTNWVMNLPATFSWAFVSLLSLKFVH